MPYDYTKLRSRMREKGYTQSSLCTAINMNEGVFSLRINNDRSFRQEEIESICNVLDIRPKDVASYFFGH